MRESAVERSVPTNALSAAHSGYDNFGHDHVAELETALMAKAKSKKTPKTVLKLPDLEQSKSAVLRQSDIL